jgi:hypothetical protein
LTAIASFENGHIPDGRNSIGVGTMMDEDCREVSAAFKARCRPLPALHCPVFKVYFLFSFSFLELSSTYDELSLTRRSGFLLMMSWTGRGHCEDFKIWTWNFQNTAGQG